jgi:hypothetical protein
MTDHVAFLHYTLMRAYMRVNRGKPVTTRHASWEQNPCSPPFLPYLKNEPLICYQRVSALIPQTLVVRDTLANSLANWKFKFRPRFPQCSR